MLAKVTASHTDLSNDTNHLHHLQLVTNHICGLSEHILRHCMSGHGGVVWGLVWRLFSWHCARAERAAWIGDFLFCTMYSRIRGGISVALALEVTSATMNICYIGTGLKHQINLVNNTFIVTPRLCS